MPKSKQTKKVKNFENEEAQSLEFEGKFAAENLTEEEGAAEKEISETSIKKNAGEAADLNENKIKDDILSVLPEIKEIEKPEGVFVPKTEEEKKYAEEHKALPTAQEEDLEKVKEQEAEKLDLEKQVEKDIEEHKQEVGTITTLEQIQAISQQQNKPQDLIQVEAILEEGLDEYYMQMPPEMRQRFKEKGEETASKIIILLKKTKVKFGKILTLIKEWLKMIPGINRWFLRQQSKIKTDELKKIKQEQEAGGQLP